MTLHHEREEVVMASTAGVCWAHKVLAPGFPSLLRASLQSPEGAPRIPHFTEFFSGKTLVLTRASGPACAFNTHVVLDTPPQNSGFSQPWG